jgi:hypothetical protein
MHVCVCWECDARPNKKREFLGASSVTYSAVSLWTKLMVREI